MLTPNNYKITLLLKEKLLTECFFESKCKLIGTGCTPEAALNIFTPFDYFLGLHALRKNCNTLSITHAAAIEADIPDNPILKFKLDGTGACVLCFVIILHYYSPRIYFMRKRKPMP